RRAGARRRHQLRRHHVQERVLPGERARHAVPPGEEPGRGLARAGERQARRGRKERGVSPRRPLAALAALSLSLAAAQGEWAVQVVALRDYREAQAASAQLLALGFPSYLEFAMNQGRQFVRVRVGCYTSREAAEAMAAALRGHVTADAQPVELSPGAAVPGCTEESVG